MFNFFVFHLANINDFSTFQDADFRNHLSCTACYAKHGPARAGCVRCGTLKRAIFPGCRWCFRWPGAQKLEKSTPPRRIELPSEEMEAILRRLRAMSAEERRNALAAMPEGTRKELMRHLKQEAGGSRLRQLLSHLPELLDSADEQKRHELMQGVRMLESMTAQVLAAPDMASVVKILRELTPQQRHAIVESLPGETQEALTAHLRAEKAAQAAQLGTKVYAPGQQSLLPALCRML
eukprot:s799_g12.t1